MKAILKAALIAALSGVVFGALLRKRSTEKRRLFDGPAVPRRVPVLSPLRDAVPNVAEPLQEQDLRVAQNTPL